MSDELFLNKKKRKKFFFPYPQTVPVDIHRLVHKAGASKIAALTLFPYQSGNLAVRDLGD
ncbi:hypothetical protein [Janthinobacterium sp. CG3]|uniref:hypothetical protein n=1 Tax=Janthinobacterium sp. CG3 TaxID=1075768 RepID=UPI0018DED1EE|nr:hypothetical protein [Janthinobacterium sp. CG3]